MSTQSERSVIYKKAQHGREDFDARAMSWVKALRLSLERGADNVFDLAVVVRALEQFSHPLAELKPFADGDRLIILLDGHSGARGAAIFDRAFVQSIVEAQTRGRVTNAALENRAFTGTDAAVLFPLINGVLASVDEMMAATPTRPKPLGLRFGDRVADSRTLLLTLEAPDYEVFRVAVDIADGARSGEMTLLVPDHMLAAPEPSPVSVATEPDGFDLHDLAMTAPVMLDTVLHRIQMPLSKVCGLKPGMCLPVARAALGRAELVGTKGHVAAKVCLGQINGFRAVRIGEKDIAEAGSASGLAVGAGASALSVDALELSLSDQDLGGDASPLAQSSEIAEQVPDISAEAVPMPLPDLEENAGAVPDPNISPDLPAL